MESTQWGERYNLKKEFRSVLQNSTKHDSCPFITLIKTKCISLRERNVEYTTLEENFNNHCTLFC